MHIFVVANSKGGTGKSTISAHLLYFLQKKKQKKVALIDADLQFSSSKWLQSSRLLCKSFTATTDIELFEHIKKLEEQEYDYCIVDSPAGLPETARSAIMLCDAVIIPTQPHLLDLQASQALFAYLEQVKKVRKGAPMGFIFLNRCHGRSLILRESEFFLTGKASTYDLNYIPHPIQNRVAFADAPNQRSFVFNMDDEKACREIYSVCSFIYNYFIGELNVKWQQEEKETLSPKLLV